MRIAITGISGYLGRLLAPLLAEDARVEAITGLDLAPPPFSHPKVRFVRCDVRDPALAGHLRGCDVLVHLAFVVQEIRDKRLAREINVDGTRNVLAAAAAQGVRRLVVASSVAAYGASPDEVLVETSPRVRTGRSYYADTKVAMEELLDRFEAEHPGGVVTRLRPSILCGPRTPNFLRDLVAAPVLLHVRGNDAGMPFVHEDDVARAFATAALEDHPGAFNLHAGSLAPRDLARMLGRRAVGVPFPLARAAADAQYALGLSSYSGHWVELARRPVRLSTEKARAQLGWQPTRTAAQAFQEMLDAQAALGRARTPTDFFKGVLQFELEANGAKGRLPCFYYDNSSITALYTASTDAVRRHLPHPDLHPAELRPGRSLVAFSAFEYRRTDIDAYNELGIAFLVTFGRRALPAADFLAQLARRAFSACVWQLPVTTERARAGGVDLYGFPKFLADIRFRRTPESVECVVSEQGRRILTLRGRVLPTRPGPLARLRTWSVKDGIPLCANVVTNPLERAQSLDGDAATLDLGLDHELGRELRGLELSERPVAYEYSPRNEAILFGPRNVLDD